MNKSPYINLRRYVEIGVVPIAKIGLEGWITAELIHARTGLIKRRLHFKNLITNSAFNAIGSDSASTHIEAFIIWCGVGTDSTAPNVSDTQLGSQLGDRINSTGGFSGARVVGPDQDYYSLSRVRLFTEAQSNGNLTEVGFFSASTSGTMWTRQLFLDDSQNPTTIVKTSEDQLKITYEWRVHTQKTPDDYQLTINSITTDVSSRGVNIGSASEHSAWGTTDTGTLVSNSVGGVLVRLGAWGTTNASVQETNDLPALSTNMTLGTPTQTTRNLQTYVSDSFQRDIEYRWDPAVANFDLGIGRILWCANEAGGAAHIQRVPWATVFDPRIQKDDTQRAIIMTRIEWARV